MPTGSVSPSWPSTARVDGEVRLPEGSTARRLRGLALRALWQELITYPKPGLVSLVDSGSHDDMGAQTFARSTLSLRRYFEQVALAGAAAASFETLRALGVEAEARMLRATGGVNTHRGAIFNLGLLAAAAGRRYAQTGTGTGTDTDTDTPPSPTPRESLGTLVATTWGEALRVHRRPSASHGSRAAEAHGAGGALVEAIGGFASVFAIGLPAYRDVLHRGGSSNQARVQAFFALMAGVSDTNLLHRAGPDGLMLAQRTAESFLARGGVFSVDWLARATAAHRLFCERRLSPGGSADLLAACVFVHAVETSIAP